MKGDIQSENDIRLNSVQKVIVTRDNGLLIAGVYDSKLTFIKTDENFDITWMKDDYEWGRYEVGSFGGGSTNAFEVINLFQDEFNNFICTGSLLQGDRGHMMNRGTWIAALPGLIRREKRSGQKPLVPDLMNGWKESSFIPAKNL
jgi:hypothetical protein